MTASENVTDVKPVQPLKQLAEREAGTWMEDKLLQFLKQYAATLLSDAGRVMDVRLVQFSYLLLVDYQYFTP